MKLICAALILAGVFALSAALSNEEEMRLVNDELMLANLNRMADNRDASSLECSKQMLDTLTQVLSKYNADLQVCNTTKEETIEALNKAARQLINSYGNSLESTCSSLSSCSEIDSTLDSFDCFEEQGSNEANSLTSLSADASTKKEELKKDIDNAVSTDEVCQTEAYAKYSDGSVQANTAFDNCVKGKPSSGGGASQPPATESPEAPEAPKEPSTPSGEEEEKDEEEKKEEEEEGRGRRLNRANKYMRF